MRYNKEAGQKRRSPYTLLAVALLGMFFIACEPDNNTLGIDLFPAEDNIVVFTDTITEFETMLVRSRPRVTSNRRTTAIESSRTFLLGSMVDTITGFSKAEIVTEFSLTQFGDFGEDPYINSLSLSLYVADIIGDTDKGMRIMVHEFLDSISMDSSYYSNYDVTDKYNPDPLIDRVIFPNPGDTVSFNIDNQDLLNRIIDATNPVDSIFAYNSNFQRNFNGLYITTEAVEEGETFAKLQLANPLAGMRFNYYHDSVSVAARDTVPISTYRISFDHRFAQKINIFHHDFTGTALENIIDSEDAQAPIAYVQGMVGVNVKIRISDLREYLGSGQIAINTARLVFDVVPDSLSGIDSEDYPQQLMMERQLPDGTPEPLYDQVINSDAFQFGRLTQSNENSAFLEPHYYFNFSIGRHFQSVLAGEIENSDLFIFVNNPVTTNKIIKFWSNHSGQEGGLRLELIYSKFD
ncbi:MAG: DUF4270 family protein [Bacteroidales bacterium]